MRNLLQAVPNPFNGTSINLAKLLGIQARPVVRSIRGILLGMSLACVLPIWACIIFAQIAVVSSGIELNTFAFSSAVSVAALVLFAVIASLAVRYSDQITKEIDGVIALCAAAQRHEKLILPYAGIKEIEVLGNKLGSFFQVQAEENDVIALDKAAAKKAAYLKDEFIGTVSHELRTPLTSIAACLGLLCNAKSRQRPEVASKLLAIALSNSERLIRLVNDILDIEKLESGKAKFISQRVELGLIAKQAIEANRPIAEVNGVKLKFDQEDLRHYVNADPGRLLQIFANLLANAIKFSPKKTTVEIKIERRPGCVRLSVRDHGLGISEEFKTHIFEKFAQADSIQLPNGGTGLGLSIVKEIAERLGGKVGFLEPADGGSKFFVDLPEVISPSVANEAPAVLVCEDNSHTSNIICQRLSEEGFHVDHAEDGGVAIKLASERSYQTILVDLTLPGIDGISLIQLLRDQPRHADTPILVISLNRGRGLEDLRACKLKIVDWLAKPSDAKQMGVELSRVLRRCDTKPARVLHIDQDIDALIVMAEVLKTESVVLSTMTLEAAREALRSESFDLAVVQLDLSRISDAEILPVLKDASGNELPVVVFSPKAENSEVAARIRAVLDKSRGSFDELVEVVKESVNGEADCNVQERQS